MTEANGQIALKVTDQGVGDYTKDALQVYGSYVVSERALADMRDGLKPVQRRILWSLYKLNAWHNKAHKKSAKITGECMGDYHPHGDAAIYAALVSMVHDNYSQLQGHGNFGSYMFPAAAPRYTECRLSKFGERCFDDINVATMVPNYSSTTTEPLVLPVKAPMLLVNGSTGIGVGISASIPSHNLGEVINATLALLSKPTLTIKSLLKHIKGPDAGYGVLVSEQQELLDLYKNGKGTLYYRCNYHYEEASDHKVLVLTSTCPGFSIGSFFKLAGKLAEAGLIMYCSDQTSSEGLRILVGFKDPNIITERVLPALIRSESYQFWAVRRQPGKEELNKDTLRWLDLKDIIQEFIDFRLGIEKARLEAELEHQMYLLSRASALLIASKNIDEVFSILKTKYTDKDAATADMMIRLNLSQEQAGFVFAAQVWSLSRISEADQKAKVRDIKYEIKQIKVQLSDLPGVVADTLRSMLDYSEDRGTEIRSTPEAIPGSDETSSVVVMARSNGYLTRDVAMDVKSRFYYDHVLTCQSYVAIADGKSCKIYQRHISYFSEENTKWNIVGLIEGDDQWIAAIDGRGKGCFMAYASYDGYFPIKDADTLVSVCGLKDEDRLLLLDDNGQGVAYKPKAFEGHVQRRNSKGRKIDELDGQTSKALRLPKGAKLFDDKGEVKIGRDGFFQFTGTTYIIGNSNYVLTRANKRLVMDRKTATVCYNSNEMQKVQPL